MSAPLLAVTDLEVRYGHIAAVRGVSKSRPRSIDGHSSSTIERM